MNYGKKRQLFGCFILFLCFLASVAGLLTAGNEEEVRYTVVLDPGHGGEDGGAVGCDGTVEKNLNLALAGLVKLGLESRGINVLMTRTEDDDTDGLSGFHKRRDLEARAETGNSSGADLYVSIHMNASVSGKDYGFQVWYGSGNAEGKRAAEILSATVEERKICNRIRAVKKVPETLYIFRTVRIPNLLVECGFISNASDMYKLNQETFRQQLAEALCDGICAYLSGINSDMT